MNAVLTVLVAFAAYALDSAPGVVTVTGVNGESRVPVRTDVTGAPVFAAPALMLALDGSARVAIGTRSAAFAPVRDLGLVACWDDGNDLHIEQRATIENLIHALTLA